MRKTIAQHAADILRETDNPAVMWGDCGLLDMIAYRAGIASDEKPLHPMDRWKRVLDALEDSPLFTKTVSKIKWGHRGNQACRVFTLIKDDAK